MEKTAELEDDRPASWRHSCAEIRRLPLPGAPSAVTASPEM